MKTPARSAALLLLALALPAGVLRAQQTIDRSDRVELLFKQALAQFTEGKDRDAVAAFDEIIRDYPASHRITAAYVMKGKALLRLNENYEAARTLKSFLSAFPGSTYAADAEFMLGVVYQRIGRYEEATQEFLTAWAKLPYPVPVRLWHEIFTALDTTVDRSLAVATLERLRDAATIPEQRSFFWMKKVEKEIARDNIPAAMVALDTLSLRYPGSMFRERISALSSEVSGRSSVKIAALLPLMRTSEPSAMKEIGSEVYDGVQFAVQQAARSPSSRVKVGLETRDTQRDPFLAEKGAQELGDQKDIIGIIGPVFSMETPPAAIAANARRTPIITPTANANGMVVAGPYVFQANPDYETRGRAMARYAVLTRGFRTLAVLAPSDTYGKYLAEGFIAEASRLGARVVATEWYPRGTSDLKPQLSNIRRAGMIEAAEPSISFVGKLSSTDLMKLVDLGVPTRRIDSLLSKGSVVPVKTLLGPLTRSRIDSLALRVVFDETKVDSLQYPVTGIAAVYVPISSAEEIGVVSSQIVYFNFQTQVLGSGEWYNFPELDANKRYCNGIMFESDTYIDSNSVSYRDFSSGFLAQFRKLPTRNTLYGYDTAMLVLSLIRDGATTREALERALLGVHDFHGLHSRIGLSPARINTWLSVLRFRDDGIAKVDDVTIDDTTSKARR